MESILFFIKRNKPLKDGTAPIYIRMTTKGSISEFSAGRSISPTDWIALKGRAKGHTMHNKQINAYLDQQEQQLRQFIIDLKQEGKQATAKEVVRRFKGEDETHTTFLELYRQHNEQMRDLVDKSIAFATYQRHCTSCKLFENFLLAEYGVKDILIKEIDQNTLKRYHHYLITVRGTANNTAVKYVRNMTKILNSAVVQGIISHSPSVGLRFKTDKVDKEFLLADELKRICDHNFEIERLGFVRDIYVFCCYTGLAYTDVHSLVEADIVMDNEGMAWIRKSRAKTGNMCDIPLLSVAKNIIEKYQPNFFGVAKVSDSTKKIFPVLSNQKMNAYLKEIADICSVDKNLSTHSARHTFATTVTLANRVTIESVSKMLGHSTIKMTQQYARVLNSTLAEQMKEVDQKITRESH